MSTRAARVYARARHDRPSFVARINDGHIIRMMDFLRWRIVGYVVRVGKRDIEMSPDKFRRYKKYQRLHLEGKQ